MPTPNRHLLPGLVLTTAMLSCDIAAQTPPTAKDMVTYSGLHAAVVNGELGRMQALLASGIIADSRDNHGRTPLHVAAFAGDVAAMEMLVAGGANPNAFEADRYDIVTIAAVANDIRTLKAALRLGARATNITSPYEGTALIAAAHLGHVEVVKTLIDAGAPLDHVNNINWTAVIESIVLGDGGPRHLECLRALVEAGADLSLPDGDGRTPLQLAKERGYTSMIELLEQAGAE